MDNAELIEYCLTKPGAVHDYKAEWEADRVCVSGKMFAMLGDLNGRPIISLKSEPDRADVLRQAYDDIIPGYYLNKKHWNTLFLDGSLPEELVYESIDHSYRLVTQGLTKKVQKALGLLGE
ncbi:MmcQ/YjbR family DNA-binding protein [Enterobacillus tribolii]|uniref:Putative DNA-binding protein (MmcQ/YjbR family) n=1 Tax=Enterobacillus tribolii TaxID=1487935 RepID=A0A370QRY1_9GAMM|nr:MmcQ/YjbR family DNA-binding protein [Enterobacillus tribolii]MBW7983487.1 MmcQ/YjbR family DNA-binding protein [Enterobacillus tribolii]RDK92017.1 putative DNA-binding protein (MmcQ/YjbR family) [Enterobacillus tribolii]